jgi:hypothetical protein
MSSGQLAGARALGLQELGDMVSDGCGKGKRHGVADLASDRDFRSTPRLRGLAGITPATAEAGTAATLLFCGRLKEGLEGIGRPLFCAISATSPVGRVALELVPPRCTPQLLVHFSSPPS